MLPATLLSPSDIKPALGVFKSILSTCTAQQAGQQITAGRHRHTRQQSSTCDSSGHTGQQATSWADQQPPQAGQLTACTTGHQQATACQRWAELGRSADQAKNPAKSGQNQPCSKGKKPALMTLCPPIELELFYYCTYPVLYANPVQFDKNGFFLARIKKTPPRPIFFGPFFFLDQNLIFLPKQN